MFNFQFPILNSYPNVHATEQVRGFLLYRNWELRIEHWSDLHANVSAQVIRPHRRTEDPAWKGSSNTGFLSPFEPFRVRPFCGQAFSPFAVVRQNSFGPLRSLESNLCR